jgi:hypothetical protein
MFLFYKVDSNCSDWRRMMKYSDDNGIASRKVKNKKNMEYNK